MTPMARWMAIPLTLALMVLVGFALSSESRDEFDERSLDNPGRNQNQDQQPGRQPQRQTEGSDQGQEFEPATGDQPAQTEDGEGDDPGANGDSVVITTDNGDIVITVDEDGQPVAMTPLEGQRVDADRVLEPDPDGEFAGVRGQDTGAGDELQPIRRDDLQPDDLLLQPNEDGGVTTISPDGTVVELSFDPEGELVADGIPVTVDDQVILQPVPDPDRPVDPDRLPVVVSTEEGTALLDLDDEGNVVARSGGDIVDLDEDDLSAIRIGEDGRLEVVPIDEVQPEDTLVVPAEGGVDVLRPDGSRIELRPDGDSGGISATEIQPDGTETELIPNPDGTITLEDGTTIGPIDFPEDAGPIERIIEQAGEMPWVWVFAAIALLTLLSAGVAYYLHRNRPDEIDFDFGAAPITNPDRFEQFLTALAADPDPTRAVRIAFHWAERGLAGLPPRRTTETPFEWHARVAESRPAFDQPLGIICDQFAKARFAPQAATTEDRDLVVQSLRQLDHRSRGRADEMVGV